MFNVHNTNQKVISPLQSFIYPEFHTMSALLQFYKTYFSRHFGPVLTFFSSENRALQKSSPVYCVWEKLSFVETYWYW